MVPRNSNREKIAPLEGHHDTVTGSQNLMSSERRTLDAPTCRHPRIITLEAQYRLKSYL